MMKIVLNGNHFYYGRALVSYNPYLTDDAITRNRGFFEEDLVGASQKPHFLLDPTTSQGGQMELPFLWPENYLDITKTNWHADMGRVTIHDFDTLHHSNGSTDPITVSVFVWATDVRLAVPTTVQAQSAVANRQLDDLGFPTYVEQAGSSTKKSTMKANNTSTNSEFVKDGLISKPASAVAKAAKALQMIPMIAPYAKATELIATRMGQVAKIFGYSRPQILDDIRPYVPRFMGNLCNSDAPEALTKLSIDSKNELTVDTRVMGLGGEDELAISAIARRPSYWQQFDWPESATADTLLASMKVLPTLVRTLNNGVSTEIHPTALSFASFPFGSWQGTIKFRFNVVCSEYHRGRLRIVYNPRSNSSGAVPYNQVYSTIVDISENRDIEYEVKWADVRAWNSTFEAVAAAALPSFSTSSSVNAGGQSDNGSLSVYVVNELATPGVAAAAVKVQVWVCGGDDIAFAVPTTRNLDDVSYFEEQSAIAPYEPQAEGAPAMLATDTDDSNAPDCSNQVESFGTDSDYINDDNQYLVYQGERIVSFREMLRRYHYHASYFPGSIGSGTRIVSIDLTDFPYYRGWDPKGADSGTASTAVPAPYNFCNTTLLNYLTPAFAMRRGSIRHKAIITGKNTSGNTGTFGVARHGLAGASNALKSRSLSSTLIGDRRSKILKTLRSSLGGTLMTPIANNPVLEYETPFYTLGQRFVPARDIDYYGKDHMAHELSTEVFNTDDDLKFRIDKYVSIGEDFQLGLFVGAPVLFTYANPTAV